MSARSVVVAHLWVEEFFEVFATVIMTASSRAFRKTADYDGTAGI
jgi:hypothetical protein